MTSGTWIFLPGLVVACSTFLIGCGCSERSLEGETDAATVDPDVDPEDGGDLGDEEAVSAPACGNWRLEDGEECDDGNDVLWDGCNECEIVEFQVNTHTESRQQRPDVHLAEDGSFTVVWTSWEQDGDDGGVYAQRYDGDGEREGAEFRVNDGTESDQNLPRIAGARDGRFVVVWTNYMEFEGYDIRARVFDGSGAPVTSDLDLAAGQRLMGNQASVAMSSSGSFVVVWAGMVEDGTVCAVMGRRFSAVGTPLGPSIHANTLSGCSSAPSVAMSDDGDFAVVWPSDDYEIVDPAFHARLYSSSGEARGDEFRIDPHTGTRTTMYDVSMSSGGDFILVWKQIDVPAGCEDLVCKLFDVHGSPLGSVFLASTTTDSSIQEPAVSLGDDGHIIVAWHGFVRRSGDDVFLRHLDGSGAPLDTERTPHAWQLNNQRLVSISQLPDGRHVAVWQSEEQDGDVEGIFAQRFDAAGNPLGTLPW